MNHRAIKKYHRSSVNKVMSVPNLTMISDLDGIITATIQTLPARYQVKLFVENLG